MSYREHELGATIKKRLKRRNRVNGAADGHDCAAGANVDGRVANEARFSTIAAKVDNLTALALNIPDLRLAKVLALKAQIDAGTYQVPAERVADSLLDYMRLRA
jgi:flagellar biosynthesis anti-sigma factor FlgM